MYSWLQEAIAADTEVVTASRRLSRELRAAYDTSQLAAGNGAWITPCIKSWPEWLADKFEGATDPVSLPARIDPGSADVLWERCLRRSLPEGVLNVAGIVRQTRKAWLLMNDWQVPADELSSTAQSMDERLFALTAAAYRDALAKSGWIDGARLAALIVDLAEQGRLRLPARILFAGFDRPAPVVCRMMTALGEAGCDAAFSVAPSEAGGVAVAEFENHAAEMRSAGAWARRLLNLNPAARIGIVCPNLETGAEDARRLVLEGLAPGWQQGGKRYRNAVNVSYGRRLAEYPAIHIALLLLRWLGTGVTSREASIMLRSKCIGDGDVAGRSRLELALRSLPDRVWSVAAFRSAVRGRASGDDVESLSNSLRLMEEFSSAAQEDHAPTEWARRIDRLLQDVHWPGEQALSSDEFQLINRWRRLLNDFGRIAQVAPQVSLADTVQRLMTIAADTVYQPEVSSASIQLLGALEAAGMQFDGLWISGLDATQWPPSGRPSPYLSRALQRKLAMPDATPADSLEFAQSVLERLVAASPQCVVSWCSKRDDAELSPSPLLEAIAKHDFDGPADDPGWYAARLVGSNATEPVIEDPVPCVAADEIIRGGSYVVQRQADEPFSAFVYGRLGVCIPDRIEPGLSARMRGNIIHDTLHNLLRDRPDQSAILRWTDSERLQKCGSAIDAALAKPLKRADATLQSILSIERRRLLEILNEFLNEECARVDFTVADVEAAIDFKRGNVRLGLRVDRIDSLTDGSLLIIDYKSGTPKSFLTRSGVPADLQLPLYADAVGAHVGGLTLINIDSRQITYKGAGGSIEWDPDGGENWAERLSTWRSIVHRTVDQFAAGDVRIKCLLPAGERSELRILARQWEFDRVD
jgi:probable DNA repair protein